MFDGGGLIQQVNVGALLAYFKGTSWIFPLSTPGWMLNPESRAPQMGSLLRMRGDRLEKGLIPPGINRPQLY